MSSVSSSKSTEPSRRYPWVILFTLFLLVQIFVGVYMDDSTEEVTQFWEPLHQKVYGTSLSAMTDTENFFMNHLVSIVSQFANKLRDYSQSKMTIYLTIKILFAILSALNQTFLIYVMARKVDVWSAHFAGYLLLIVPEFYAYSSGISYSPIKMHLCMLALSVAIYRSKMILVPLAYAIAIFCAPEFALLLFLLIMFSNTSVGQIGTLIAYSLTAAFLFSANDTYKLALQDLLQFGVFNLKFNSDAFTYLISNLFLNFNVMSIMLFMFIIIPAFKELLKEDGDYINSLVYVPGITLSSSMFCYFFSKTSNNPLYNYPLVIFAVSISWTTSLRAFIKKNCKKVVTLIGVLVFLLFTTVCLSRIILITNHSHIKKLFRSVPLVKHDSPNRIICYPRDWVDFQSHFFVPEGYRLDTLNTLSRHSTGDDFYTTTAKCDVVIRWDFRSRFNVTLNVEEELGIKNVMNMLSGIKKNYNHYYNGTEEEEAAMYMFDYKYQQVKSLMKTHNDYILDELGSAWKLHYKLAVTNVNYSPLFVRSFWIPGVTEQKMFKFNYKMFVRTNEH